MTDAIKFYEQYSRMDGTNRSDFTFVLNEARKEIIKECAEKIVPDGNPLSAKQSILKLIEQVK